MPFESFFGTCVSASCFSGVSTSPGAMFIPQTVLVAVVACCACRVVISKLSDDRPCIQEHSEQTHAGLSMHHHHSASLQGLAGYVMRRRSSSIVFDVVLALKFVLA